jgi:hypothetical protein
MPKIKESYAPTTDVAFSPQDIYEQCLYDPSAIIIESVPPDGGYTFEALNGGLSFTNIKTSAPSAKGTFHADKYRVGTFAQGYSVGFNFPERYHHAQFAQTNHTNTAYGPGDMLYRWRPSLIRNGLSSYSLSSNIFIPYKSHVYLNYQGFFAHDGTLSEKTGDWVNANEDRATYFGNFYLVRMYVDGNYQPGTECRVPSSRYFRGTEWTDYLPLEHRFRWHNKSRVLHLEKGYHTVDIRIYPSLVNGPQNSHDGGKLHNYCGSVSILAIKAGSNHISEATVVLDIDTPAKIPEKPPGPVRAKLVSRHDNSTKSTVGQVTREEVLPNPPSMETIRDKINNVFYDKDLPAEAMPAVRQSSPAAPAPTAIPFTEFVTPTDPD